VLEERVGAVWQVAVVLDAIVDVELGVADELMLAEAVIVDNVDAEVNVALVLALKLLDVVDEAHPLICFAPQTEESALELPIDDLR
jgi:hypothetical protein